jgi:polyphosphate kinase
VPVEDDDGRRAIDEILDTILADDRRSWQLSPDGRWHRTERLTGAEGTVDAQQLFKIAATARAREGAAARRPHAGTGSLEPWA